MDDGSASCMAFLVALGGCRHSFNYAQFELICAKLKQINCKIKTNGLN
jgi:hypothetical protein